MKTGNNGVFSNLNSVCLLIARCFKKTDSFDKAFPANAILPEVYSPNLSTIYFDNRSQVDKSVHSLVFEQLHGLFVKEITDNSSFTAKA